LEIFFKKKKKKKGFLQVWFCFGESYLEISPFNRPEGGSVRSGSGGRSGKTSSLDWLLSLEIERFDILCVIGVVDSLFGVDSLVAEMGSLVGV